MGKKGDSGDFERDMVVFQKLLIYGDFHAQPSRGFTENGLKNRKYPVSRSSLVDARGQRRTAQLVRDDRKATVTQITTRYNQGLQKTISERTTHRTLKQTEPAERGLHLLHPLSPDWPTG